MKNGFDFLCLYLLKINLLKKLLLFISLAIPCILSAQKHGSINVFSEKGEKFFLYLDGKKQNETAYANVRVEELPDLYYSVKIIFENSGLGTLTKSIVYVSDGDDNMQDVTYRLRTDKSGKPRLVFHSMLSPKEKFVPKEGMYVFKYNRPAVAETYKEETKPVTTGNTSNLGSLNIFSQNGDKFYLYLNGIQQNKEAQSNVCIRRIPGIHYNVKIVFAEGSKLWPITKNNVFISDGDDELMDATYRIRKDKNGVVKLNFYSLKKPAADFVPSPGMYVYEFGNPNALLASGDNKPAKSKTAVATENKKAEPAGKTTTQKATTTNAIAKTKAKENPANVATPVKTKAVESVPENKKCNGWPMGKGDLDAAKKMVIKAKKEDDKLSAAQEAILSNCLSVSQVVEFCNLFQTDNTKLNFAKFAYKYTLDRKNYNEVEKVFKDEASKQELNKFIHGG